MAGGKVASAEPSDTTALARCTETAHKVEDPFADRAEPPSTQVGRHLSESNRPDDSAAPSVIVIDCAAQLIIVAGPDVAGFWSATAPGSCPQQGTVMLGKVRGAPWRMM